MTALPTAPATNDLSTAAPRSPRERIGGYVIMARMIDKGRAVIAGTGGEYHFDCPVDNLLFSFKGVNGDDVRKVLTSGATDTEVAEWFNRNGTPKSVSEIAAWSEATEQLTYFHHPEKHGWFVAECQKLGLDPARTTLFDYLEVDDRISFKR